MTQETQPPFLQETGIPLGEYQAIVRLLGREPNRLELYLFKVMWSEHCSYKNSRPLLRLLPKEGPAVLQGPGENAGVVEIGEGWAVAFKIESHNHPSAVEPVQGAATGVGGIIRDIVAMGARPIALLNSLRFGRPDDPRTRYLVRGWWRASPTTATPSACPRWGARSTSTPTIRKTPGKRHVRGPFAYRRTQEEPGLPGAAGLLRGLQDRPRRHWRGGLCLGGAARKRTSPNGLACRWATPSWAS